ncbi:hypothetical protein CHARACLAT_012030 [Characodon lateralis]|uniref:Uncharacterized protein n=1 Tax=Characodon lateralis TaxID=208331 RepID=A0ABU7EM03_9TELE|nr:hypothetical protein [Characodon lateralis]
MSHSPFRAHGLILFNAELSEGLSLLSSDSYVAYFSIRSCLLVFFEETTSSSSILTHFREHFHQTLCLLASACCHGCPIGHPCHKVIYSLEFPKSCASHQICHNHLSPKQSADLSSDLALASVISLVL